MKFSATITEWGPDALGFLEDPDMNFIIIFNDNAPEELKEIAILHTQSEVFVEPKPGDTVILCDKVFDITAVGSEAVHTLRTLGHCTLSFKGGAEAERPGCIMLQGDDPLTVQDIKAGAAIEIF